MINNSTQQVIWVLSDDRPGNYSQAIGLAEELAEELAKELSKTTLFSTKIKKINYNFLAKLPNFLKIDAMLGINQSSKASLLNIPDHQKPNIIISAGRKTAPIAAFLKKYYQAFTIQIMNPNCDFTKFDAVVLPNHDKARKENNIIRIIGSLTRIKDDLLISEYQKFSDILGKINSPKIALLVGGSSKKGTFTTKIANDLGQLISNIVKQMNGNLLVLNSRRTGEVITEALDQSLNCLSQSKLFFKWKNKDWQNPYFAVLQSADFIVATGDSISMCSEICCLGKPVYIFNPPEICSSKHLKFHQDLFDQGFARKLNIDTQILENYSATKLEETKRIAELISNIYSTKRL